ncbi:MAG TPA: DUF5058 family protein, partial [Oscillospiraceae bacterium]|nr:DUF5058 family protein [Oscillospiraceae bacterium]
MDFKESGFMYLVGGFVVFFIVCQSLFFLIKAWRQGRKLGLSAKTLKDTVSSSVLFTLAPALAILATVITLAGALGLVVPWIRLTVIGNISYEVTAAQSTLEAFGIPGGLAVEIKDKEVFTAAVWVMTVGSVFPLVLLPLFFKKIHNKIGQALSSKGGWSDVMSAAAFIGLISAFLAKALAGAGDKNIIGDGAGVLSLLTLISSIVFMLAFEFVCKRYKLKWLEPFAM